MSQLEDLTKKEILDGSLVVMVGLPATGKSTVAKKIESIKNFLILRTDMIRKEIYSQEELFDKNIAGTMESRKKVYNEMFNRAQKHLKNFKEKSNNSESSGSRGVILDATFVKKSLRERAYSIASECKCPLFIIQTTCSEGEAVKRIESRTKESYESNALSADVYYQNEKIFEPVSTEYIHKKYPTIEGKFIVVNTEGTEGKENKIEKIAAF